MQQRDLLWVSDGPSEMSCDGGFRKEQSPKVGSRRQIFICSLSCGNSFLDLRVVNGGLSVNGRGVIDRETSMGECGGEEEFNGHRRKQ